MGPGAKIRMTSQSVGGTKKQKDRGRAQNAHHGPPDPRSDPLPAVRLVVGGRAAGAGQDREKEGTAEVGGTKEK